MATLTFMLGSALLFLLLTSSTAEVVTDDELEIDILKRLLEELSDDKDKRIIGGVDIQEGFQPFLVSLQAEIPTETKFFGWFTTKSKKLHCGGTLVARDVVLTGAHCFVNPDIGSKARDPQYWKARMGETHLESSFWEGVVNTAGSVFGQNKWRKWEIDAEDIIIYKAYDARIRERKKYDIALLKLKEAVPDDEPRVGLVNLTDGYDRNFPRAGDKCVAFGWGCKVKGGSLSEVGQRVELTVLSEKRCRSVTADWDESIGTRICAGEERKGKGICAGDDGGPLMCERDGTWYQVGIASFASETSPESSPGLFTRVSAYKDWIDEKLKDFEEEESDED